MADTPPNPVTPTPPDDSQQTSADVATGKFSKVIKGLETRISTLEDTNKKLADTNKSYEEKFKLLSSVPSPTVPGKNILQTLDEWLFPPKPQA